MQDNNSTPRHLALHLFHSWRGQYLSAFPHGPNDVYLYFVHPEKIIIPAMLWEKLTLPACQCYITI